MATSPMGVIGRPVQDENFETEDQLIYKNLEPVRQSPREVKDESIETDPVQISPISEH